MLKKAIDLLLILDAAAEKSSQDYTKAHNELSAEEYKKKQLTSSIQSSQNLRISLRHKLEKLTRSTKSSIYYTDRLGSMNIMDFE